MINRSELFNRANIQVTKLLAISKSFDLKFQIKEPNFCLNFTTCETRREENTNDNITKYKNTIKIHETNVNLTTCEISPTKSLTIIQIRPNSHKRPTIHKRSVFERIFFVRDDLLRRFIKPSRRQFK